MNRINWPALVLLMAIAVMVPFFSLRAQTEPQPPISNPPAVDSDLDGLTDAGERDIYHTDPNKADTDGDGFLDAAEVLGQTDPLDSSSNSTTRKEPIVGVAKEVPWAWYITRSSGIVAFVLLYLSFFFGFAMRLPWLRKIFPMNFFSVHKWVSVQALLFTFVHAGVLLFDKYLKLSLVDILIPFASSFQPTLIGLGVIGMYLMILLIITSYLQKRMSFKVWRVTHYSSVFLYIFVLIHTLYLGTDFKNPLMFNIVIGATALLFVLMVLNIREKIKNAIAKKRRLTPTAV